MKEKPSRSSKLKQPSNVDLHNQQQQQEWPLNGADYTNCTQRTSRLCGHCGLDILEHYLIDKVKPRCVTPIDSCQSFTSCWEYLLLSEKLRTMVQPEAYALSSIVPSKPKSKRVPKQDRRQRWKKNYMMMSLPCQSSHRKSIKDTHQLDFYTATTQSLHSQTSHSSKRDGYQKRLLKILRRCADSIEEIASTGYVNSMRSCTTTSSSFDSVDFSAVNHIDNLIDLSGSVVAEGYSHNFSSIPHSDSKNLSEILLRDGGKLGGVTCEPAPSTKENYYFSLEPFNKAANSPAVFVTPRLRPVSSCSSYVGDSDLSYTDAQPLNKCHRKRRFKQLNSQSVTHTEDYYDLVSNGKSTPFLSEDECDMIHQSFYYDDEFEQDSELAGLVDDQDLEAAICNQYANLLDKTAAITGRPVHRPNTSLNRDTYESNLSSDFENLFPSSLSLGGEDNNSGELVITEEENQILDVSVPNYSDMPCAAPPDYQITFAQAGSLYSDARSSCDESDGDEEGDQNYITPSSSKTPSIHHKPNQVPKPPRRRGGSSSSDLQISAKKVSFSDELATITGDHDDLDTEQKMEKATNSTTWLQMKENYTTWGQVKVTRDDPKKSRSTPDIRQEVMGVDSDATRRLEDESDDMCKRYSLTLWEQYKRAHCSFDIIEGELRTPEAFSAPLDSASDERCERINTAATNIRKQREIRKSIDIMLDDVLGQKSTASPTPPTHSKLKEELQLPDLSFIKKYSKPLTENSWWGEIFTQPSFCNTGTSARTCSRCDRKHSSDHQVIVFEGDQPTQHRVCEISMLEQILMPSSQCRCIKEKLCELSSGIATGSSGVTPREPNSWQHIADFLKRKQRTSDGNSRGSLNSNLNDQQLLDVVGCVEAADALAKHCSQPEQDQSADVLLLVWKLVSGLECIFTLGLKSHQLVSVTMGRIRTRVSVWDVVEESAKSTGGVTDTFNKVLQEISNYKIDDISIRLCLFIAGLLNYQCLDFWVQIVIHNKELLDRFYQEDSLLRSKVIGDRKLRTDVLQALQPLSLAHWDISYQNIITACTRSIDNMPENDNNARVTRPKRSPASSPTSTTTCHQMPPTRPLTRNLVTNV